MWAFWRFRGKIKGNVEVLSILGMVNKINAIYSDLVLHFMNISLMEEAEYFTANCHGQKSRIICGIFGS